VGFLSDVDEYTDWMENVAEAKFLEGSNDEAQHVYTLVDLPFPFTDRDSVFDQKITQDPETLAVTIVFSATPEALPKDEKIIRIVDFAGSWVLEPVDATTIKATYAAHVDPAGSLPKWLLNKLISQGPYKTLRNLHDDVTFADYNDVKLPFIKNKS